MRREVREKIRRGRERDNIHVKQPTDKMKVAPLNEQRKGRMSK